MAADGPAIRRTTLCRRKKEGATKKTSHQVGCQNGVSPYKGEGRAGRNKGFQCKAMNQQLHSLDDCTGSKHLC